LRLAQGVDGISALFLAVQSGHIVVAEELILAGARVDVPRTDGVTSLACAAQHGDLEMLQLLLFNGADVHYEDERGLLMCCHGRRNRGM